MAFETDEDIEFVIKETGGAFVEYQGLETWCHQEQATIEAMARLGIELQIIGYPMVIIGARGRFGKLAAGDLITVEGDDWNVGESWLIEDGKLIAIALKNTART